MYNVSIHFLVASSTASTQLSTFQILLFATATFHANSSAVAFNELLAGLRCFSYCCPNWFYSILAQFPSPFLNVNLLRPFFVRITALHFLFALHFMLALLQNMYKNYTEKIFSNVQQNAVIISNLFCKFDINQP